MDNIAERKWTPAQKAAIEDEGGSLLIDAAAGSGKTAVLVERAVRLMTRDNAPLPADRLLILTFTNAAADELRARLASRLEMSLSQNPESVFLRRQKMLLHRAFIGTIDAFCQQLVREHFALLNVPPDVSVGQAARLSALSEAALGAVMEQMAENEDFVRFTGLYGRARSDAEAAAAVLRLHTFVDTLPWPKNQLARFAAMYETSTPLAETPWGKELFGWAKQALEAALALSKAARRHIDDDPALAPWLPALAEDEDNLTRLYARVVEGDWDGAQRLLQGFAPARLAAVCGYEGEGKERIKLLREKIKRIAEDLRKNCFACTEAEYRQDLAEAGPMVRALCEATALYADAYREAKLEEKSLDFSDFEHLALGLLMDEDGNRTPHAEAVSARYDVVMVDEYQDTNELQGALYACLGRPGGDNLFFVGDVKQSIYRFRRANPGLFLQKKTDWAPFETGLHPAVLRLGHNFRSGPAVIGAVNFLFETLMSESLGEVAYGEQEKLIQGSEGGCEDGFCFALLQDEDGHGDAGWVAAQIADMVCEKKMTVRGEDGEERPCTYGDICILLRTRGAMAAYLSALEALGIPAVCDMDDDILGTPEVLPLRAVLAAVDNPGDDVNLAAAMLGPLFRFTPDEITAIRAGRPKGSLYGAVLGSADEKAKRFLATLAHFRTLATEMDAGRLCEEIATRTGYLSAVAAMEGGAMRRESLHRFIAWAGEMAAGQSGGLAAFVRLLEGGRGPQSAGYKGIPGHVSILTAHKSKGLEFPVVFFADTARGFNMRDRAERIQLHAELGVGLWLRGGQTLFPTLPLLAIRRRCERESLSEEMRVLYVALTRAKDRLIISYAKSDPAKKLAELAELCHSGTPDSYLLSRSRCFGEWLLSALLLHPGAGPLWEACGTRPGVLSNSENQLEITLAETIPPSAAPPVFALTAEADEEAAARIAEGFTASMPRSALREVPRKLSVSALAKAGAPSVRRRPSILYKSGLTAAERGTAMHGFLQLADFTAAKTGLEDEIARLVKAGKLLAEQAAALDRAGLAAFLASPLAARMAGAKRLLREYDFITALPAGRIDPALPAPLAQEPVYLQGIADAVLVGEADAEIADYKTDRGKTAEELRETYAGQLRLYADAVGKRLSLPVTRLTLWSFALEREVDVPLG